MGSDNGGPWCGAAGNSQCAVSTRAARNKLTLIITSRHVRAEITGKLLILYKFDLRHFIRTTLLYKILFAEFKKLFWF